MKRSFGCLLFSVVFLSIPYVYAQNSDQTLPDSEVLVSPPAHDQVSDQDDTSNDSSSNASSLADQDNLENTIPQKRQFKEPTSNQDDIVAKATGVVINQMKANMKLTPDQISAVGPIISGNIAKVRSLQQSLEDGTIDSATMFSQRQELVSDEIKQLGSVLTPDQMKAWLIMQNQPGINRSIHSSSK